MLTLKQKNDVNNRANTYYILTLYGILCYKHISVCISSHCCQLWLKYNYYCLSLREEIETYRDDVTCHGLGILKRWTQASNSGLPIPEAVLQALPGWVSAQTLCWQMQWGRAWAWKLVAALGTHGLGAAGKEAPTLGD